jgi:predicted TIM-barrel fold metal-dependent hydrolase
MLVTRRDALKSTAAAGAAVLLSRPRDAAAVPLPSTPVKFDVPKGLTDIHRHVVGHERQYAFIPTSRYRLEPATIEDMEALDRALGIDRVVLVALMAYGSDNSCLLDGLKKLGKRGRGMPIITETTTDRDMEAMHRAGCRGIRLPIGPGVEEARGRLKWAGQRLKPYGWHINTLGLLSRLDALQHDIAASPVPIVFDHYLDIQVKKGLDQPGVSTLLKLMNEGHVYVKLTATYRVSHEGPHYADAAPIAQALIKANPQRVLWGTDWPHAAGTIDGYADRDVVPYLSIDDAALLNQVPIWAPDPAVRRLLLVENAARICEF